MNYQPNYYNNPYLSYYYPQQQAPLQQQLLQQPQMQQTQSTIQALQPVPQTQQMQQMPALNGKIVDSEDVVKVTEIPFGGYGIFPKADLNEIYLKTWNNRGTTDITKYRPVQEPVSQEAPAITTTELLEHIQKLEGKIDSIIERGNQVTIPITSAMIPQAAPALVTSNLTQPTQTVVPEAPKQVEKKEVLANAF